MIARDGVFIRTLDVTARVGDEVGRPDGLLLETLIGRYVLNADARDVWLRLDGQRTVEAVCDDVAAERGLPVDQVRDQVGGLIQQLLDLRVLEER